MIILRQVGRSAGLYPITLLYLGGVCLIMAVAGGLLPPLGAVVTLAFVAVLATFYTSYKELCTVHMLLERQRTDLLARIDQLNLLLQRSGVSVPAGIEIEQEAREDTTQKGKV